MPQPFIPPDSAPVAEPGDIDPVGLWYRARLTDGVDDRMWFGFFERPGAAPHWVTLSHRHYDGIGALAVLFAQCGWRIDSLPAGRDRKLPGLLARPGRQAPRPPPARGIPRWRALDVQRAGETAQQPPAAVLLDADESLQIDRAARTAGVSTSSWLLWTADRTTRALLAEADAALPWVFPVNLRGAVTAPRETMNHCSGITVQLDAGTGAGDLHAQTAARLAAGEHLAQWHGLNIGRWIGAGGVRLLYRLIRAPAGRHAGSWSNLGDWPPPGFHGDGLPEPAGLVGVAPGSPAYPVSAATLRWRECRTLACRLHPVLDAPGRADAFVAHWRSLATGSAT